MMPVSAIQNLLPAQHFCSLLDDLVGVSWKTRGPVICHRCPYFCSSPRGYSRATAEHQRSCVRIPVFTCDAGVRLPSSELLPATKYGSFGNTHYHIDVFKCPLQVLISVAAIIFLLLICNLHSFAVQNPHLPSKLFSLPNYCPSTRIGKTILYFEMIFGALISLLAMIGAGSLVLSI